MYVLFYVLILCHIQVHVLQWFFVPGYELQMTQDEVVAAVAATSGDTHANKLTKFMRTCVCMGMTPQILKQDNTQTSSLTRQLHGASHRV